MTTTKPVEPPLSRGSRWRGGLLGYGLLALFGVASAHVTRMNGLWLGVATLGLSLPIMAALWHQSTIRHLIALHQFQHGRFLHWWGSKRALGIVVRAALAIGLAAATLLQSVFFGKLEWLLFVLSPVLYQLVRVSLESFTARQFSARVYAERWSIWTTQWLMILLLVATWIGVRLLSAEVPAALYADRIYELQRGWARVPYGPIKWALDMGAWGQASIEALGQVSSAPWWRTVITLVIAPISTFGTVVLSLTGVSLSSAEVRRVLCEDLSPDPSPPPVGAGRAAIWALFAVIGGGLLFQLLAIGSRLPAQDSPFAIVPLPQCEQIDGRFYRVNTSKLLDSLTEQLKPKLANYSQAACAKLSDVELRAAAGVDAYLDWYFTLGAEWSRLVLMLTGDIDVLLANRFTELVLSNKEIEPLLQRVQADQDQQWTHVADARVHLQDILAQNRLVVDERGCKIVSEHPGNSWSAKLEADHARLATGPVAGLIGGGFALKVTAKAMSKAAMKSAGKVLAKVAAKKAASKGVAAAVGAMVGSLIPGAGTVLGAAIGAAIGLTVGTSIDMAALSLEEKLTREDMRKDLLSAITETLKPYRETLQCVAQTSPGR